MFEQTFKNIDEVLPKEAGRTTVVLDYREQTFWLLFLKYLDDLDLERTIKAEPEGKSYEYITNQARKASSGGIAA